MVDSGYQLGQHCGGRLMRTRYVFTDRAEAVRECSKAGRLVRSKLFLCKR